MAGIFRMSQDPRSQAIDQLGQSLGQGIGQGLSGKTLKSMFQDVLDAGGSPLTAMQKIMPFDSDLAEKLSDAELKKRGRQTLKDLVLQHKPEWAQHFTEDTDPIVAMQTLADFEQQESTAAQRAEENRRADERLALEARRVEVLERPGSGSSSPFNINMSGAQLKARFPNKAEVKTLDDSKVYPARISGDTLEGVGSTKPPAPASSKAPWEIGQAHRKEYNALPEVRQAKEIVTKYDVMTKAVEESRNPATENFVGIDQAIITLFNKMTDPSSVVRESEYARTPGDLALVNKLKGKVDKISGGGPGLTQPDREAIFDMGTKFFTVYQSKLKRTTDRFSKIMRSAGVDPAVWLTPLDDVSGMSDEELERALRGDKFGSN